MTASSTTDAPRVKSDAWSVPKRPKLRVNIVNGAKGAKNSVTDIRPLTATLDHPLILDPALLTTLDMTGFTKAGLLTVSRLCGLSLVNNNKKKKKPRRVTISRSPRKTGGNSSCDEESVVETLKMRRMNNFKVDDVFGGVLQCAVPEPCRTCGRPEHPERFHSHPKPVKSTETPGKVDKPVNRVPISKPVPANFRSADKLHFNTISNIDNKNNAGGEDKIILDQQTRVKSAGRPKAVTCYICSRDFGTASFPLHEPKCIQKWERENQSLPADQRRKLPARPTVAINSDYWNEFAWKASQKSLVACPNCKRTFAADRLPVHQRSCKPPSRPNSSSSTSSSPSPNRPRTKLCYICGREFGTKSIGIHEPQCLNKWRQQNLMLPVKLRQPEPVKPDSSDVQAIWTSHLDSLVPCRKCNRKFFPERIERHEEVCSQLHPNAVKITPRK